MEILESKLFSKSWKPTGILLEVPRLINYEDALSICQQEIDEACKKQREICRDEFYKWAKADFGKDKRNADEVILNAPSPKESE